MIGPRRVEVPTGLRAGDHVCWAFADATDFSATVLPYFDEGRRRGEQLLLIGASRPALLDALVSLPGRDELLDAGQLQLWGVADGSDTVPEFDPSAHLRALQTEADAALGRGRSGLRVASDASLVARRGAHACRQLHVYERLADAMLDSVAMTLLCLYDLALGKGVLGPVTLLHPHQHWGEHEAVAYLCGRGPWLSLHGEVDVTQAGDLLRALVDVTCEAPGEVVVDLAELRFLDVAGARMLATAVGLLAEVGVQLRLARPRRLVRRCLEMFDLAVAPPVSA
jgi:anti-anti-sigma factor